MRKNNDFKLWSSNQNPDEHTYQNPNGQMALKKLISLLFFITIVSFIFYFFN